MITMKVKELIKTLEKVDPNLEVFCTSNSGSYDYGRVHSVKPKSLAMVDGDGFTTNHNAKEKTVLIIDEK